MKKEDWNRRDFIVKPILWAGAAGVLSRTDMLLAQSGNAGALLERTLGRTGLKLPVVSMGVMNTDVPGILRRGYELGIRHFDTAAVYQNGRNEEMVGSVVKEMGIRDKVVISTKIGTRASFQNTAEAKKGFVDRFDASLKRLQMDHVDILYHHGVDDADHAKSEGQIEVLQALKKQGKTRFIGISTHETVPVLNAVIPLNVFDVALVTINYTMAHDAERLATIEKAARSGMGIVAMKTQAGGTVRPDSKLPRELPSESQTALLKWVLNHDFIATAIPGFSTYEHLEQDFSVARNLAYTDIERKFLADKAFVAQAQFCHQCGECLADCPKQADIPALMRSHMYAVQYRNVSLARHTLVAAGGLGSCASCSECVAACRKTVQIGRKIEQLKELALV